MSYETWLPTLLVLGKPAVLLAQERMYEWRWEMHPMWWGWGIGMMAMMFFFWALFIVGLIVGIRWILEKAETEAGSAPHTRQDMRARDQKDEFSKRGSRR